MTSALTRLSGSAFEITLTVPWADVKAIYDKVFEELAAEIEVEGFRKGNAPKNLVEGKIDKSKVYGEVVNRILPESYQKALAEHGLKPIVSPKIQIAQAEEDKDWQFIAKAAEKPKVDLDSYQEAVKTVNASGKIWKPGDDQKTPDQEGDKEDTEKSKKINAIVEKLLEVCKIELPELLVESEVNRLMTALIEDVRAAGLTFEQYLQSSGQTQETLHKKYHEQAESALKLEFIFDAVADDLKVTVTDEEIQAVIDKEADEKKKQALKDQSYVIASIIRRENTINRLLSL